MKPLGEVVPVLENMWKKMESKSPKKEETLKREETLAPKQETISPKKEVVRKRETVQARIEPPVIDLADFVDVDEVFFFQPFFFL